MLTRVTVLSPRLTTQTKPWLTVTETGSTPTGVTERIAPVFGSSSTRLFGITTGTVTGGCVPTPTGRDKRDDRGGHNDCCRDGGDREPPPALGDC